MPGQNNQGQNQDGKNQGQQGGKNQNQGQNQHKNEKMRGVTTGPIENQGGQKLIVDVLNNNQMNNQGDGKGNNNANAFITITVFSLDGTKKEIDSKSFYVNPQESKRKKFDISGVNRYTVEIQNGNGGGGKDGDNLLVSVWAKDKSGNLLAAQRLVNEELTNLDGKKK
jgi:hypothetical protein